MKKLGLILLLFSQHSSVLVCHPKINPLLSQYIIGYGSLIDEQSKKRTDPTAEEGFPALIKGYKRSWAIYGNLPGFNPTFLSILEDKHSSFNGIIYKLSNPANIQEYDKRETIYCRKEVSDDQLNVYSIVLPKKKQIWIYSPVKTLNQPPTANYPIVQSYVDIFIRGCINIEDKFKIKHFAIDCIQSTDQWSNHWVNDRIFPRRPSFYEPYASRIDALLKENLPEQFDHIKIE